ncbi:MAG TPA: LysR family transcriptional regulator [Bradyrhizobium sp.]|nr:LysR family transcriptional regulator [Bradyrhizobium sp.]
MDRLKAMELLVTVVEQGSLSAASRKLGIPLATVSRKLSDLERHLRARLLHRSNRLLALTDAGQAYLTACKNILQEVGKAERTVSGEYLVARGDLVVTAPIVFGRLHVVPVLVAFLEAFPEIDVRLVLSDRIVNLVEENVDAAIRISELPDQSLLATRIGDIRRVVCGSPTYFKTRGIPSHPSDLKRHSCICFEGQSNPRSWSFGAKKSPIVVPIRSRLVCTTAEASIDAAKLGAGVTRVLSYQVTEAVREGHLKTVLEAYEPAPIPVSLVYQGGSLTALKLRAFVDFVAPRLRARLGGSPARGVRHRSERK